MVPLCFSILRSSHAATFEKNLTRLSRIQRRIARMNKRMNGTGNKLPAMLKSAVCHQGIPSPQPSGMAPRHSMMGSIAQKNTQSSRPTVSRKNRSIASVIVCKNYRAFTSSSVSFAIINSSLVGITSIRTLELGVEISTSAAPRIAFSLSSSSISTPMNAKFLATAAR